MNKGKIKNIENAHTFYDFIQEIINSKTKQNKTKKLKQRNL